MIDGRLIDYDEGYRDYDESLRREGECLSVGDMLTVVQGFVGKYPDHLVTGGFDDGGGVGEYDRERAVVIYLRQALSLADSIRRAAPGGER